MECISLDWALAWASVLLKIYIGVVGQFVGSPCDRVLARSRVTGNHHVQGAIGLCLGQFEYISQPRDLSQVLTMLEKAE